jgi:hypothetical protein
MPRSGVWPADPAEPVPSPTTLFPPDRPTTEPAKPGRGRSSTAAGDDAATQAVAPTSVAAAAAATLSPDGSSDPASEPGFWDLPAIDPAGSTAAVDDAAPPLGLEPAAILDAGEAALAAGDYASAALHLGLAVRVAPSIAPIILEAIGETPDAGLQMVRGDAYRAVGRETDARRAYEAAMAAAGSAVRPDPAPGGATTTSLPGLVEASDPGDPDDDSDPFAGEG